MGTPFTDANAWYGSYARKSAPVVHANLVRELEKASHELSYRAQRAEGEINQAHKMLDDLGVARLQESGLPYSLIGRLSTMTPNVEVSRATHHKTEQE